MNTSSMLTGYTDSAMSTINSSSSTPYSLFTALIEKYVDETQCSYDGWVGTGDVGSEELLHNTSLFRRLPWLTSTLTEKFGLSQGLAQVFFLFKTVDL